MFSKQWSGTGFYVNVKLEKEGRKLDCHCIITTYDDIFLEMKRDSNDMVAVFYQESDEKEVFELPLVPFILLAHSRTEVCGLATKCLPVTVKLKALLENGFYNETVQRSWCPS